MKYLIIPSTSLTKTEKRYDNILNRGEYIQMKTKDGFDVTIYHNVHGVLLINGFELCDKDWPEEVLDVIKNITLADGYYRCDCYYGCDCCKQ